jgi:ubiquinone biosynthesis protein COQ9
MDRENSMESAKNNLLDAVLLHVAFDGWSETSLRAGLADSGLTEGLGQALFSRGGIDLAVAYHQRGDSLMAEALGARDLTALRIRERINLAVRTRLELADKELVRRGAALFALPQNAAEGAALIWGSAGAIWTALGDPSQDLNWYTKRATLSAVYGATALFWLGDQTEGNAATWDFLYRRIENVMGFEKTKAGLRANPLAKALLRGPLKFLERVHAPNTPEDLPGQMKG